MKAITKTILKEGTLNTLKAPLAVAKELFADQLREYSSENIFIDNGLIGAGIYVFRIYASDNLQYVLFIFEGLRGKRIDRYILHKLTR